MPLIIKDKSNIRYIFIVLVLAAIAATAILIYYWDYLDFYLNQSLDMVYMKKKDASPVLFKKDDWWSACPVGQRICQQTTKLYDSGDLVFYGVESTRKKVNQEKLDQVKNKIRETGIMEKVCLAEPTPGYQATYYLNLDGKSKFIGYPGCEEELGQIEESFGFTN